MQILMSLKKKKYLINYTNMSQGNWKTFQTLSFYQNKIKEDYTQEADQNDKESLDDVTKFKWIHF